jgi:hypothetical protein
MYIHRDKTTTSKRTELLPKWVTAEERWLPSEPLRIMGGSATFEIISSSPQGLSFALNTSDQNTRIVIYRNYYPSWVITDESKQNYTITPTETGELSFVPSLGDHTYTLVQKSTPTATISNSLSLLTVLLIVIAKYLKKI